MGTRSADGAQAPGHGLPTLELTGGWETVLEGAARQQLEQTILPQFLRGQRWFGGKARQVGGMRMADWGFLAAGSSRAVLLLIEVDFADGEHDRYFLPLAVSGGAAAATLLQSMRSRVVARLTGGPEEALLHDALADDAVCTALLAAIAAGREFPTQGGRIRTYQTAAFRQLWGPDGVPLPVQCGPETSSNSLVYFGGRLLLKLFRRLAVGINPDFEIGRYLTEKAGFERIPRMAGTIEYYQPGSEPISLAILQEAVPNQGDGWGHAMDELGRYFERAGRRMHAPEQGALDECPLLVLTAAEPPPVVRQTIGSYLHTAATLGRCTAELHRALGADTRDPAFTPEPMTNADVVALAGEIRDLGDEALVGMREHAEDLPAALRPAAHQFEEQGPVVLECLADDPGVRPGAVKIRCHGDYHLGQVLCVGDDFFVLDFEGEPTRSGMERRAKQSPLKDVAGMLRSFNYAAYAGLFASTRDCPEDFARLERWAEIWQRWTTAAFLRAYLATAAGAPFLVADPGQLAALLDLFMLDKAFYELLYELNNRPDWVRIPLSGILSLLAARRPAPGPHQDAVAKSLG